MASVITLKQKLIENDKDSRLFFVLNISTLFSHESINIGSDIDFVDFFYLNVENLYGGPDAANIIIARNKSLRILE